MPFKPGQSGNPKGRRKGIGNKTTEEAKRVALAFLHLRTTEEIEELWLQTKGESPTKAFAMWLQAQEFVIPKLGRLEHTGEDGGPMEFVIRDVAKEGE